MMGALPYLAPEMIEKPATAGKPADVWALGAIAYELLTEMKPFGRGLLAVEKIMKSDVPPLPPALSANKQFSGLVNEIFDIILRCMRKPTDQRPTADDLVSMCGSLCYPTPSRAEGTIEKVWYGSWGFIAAGGRSVFFHYDSVYGRRPAVGESVCFAEFPGNPRSRAHPVLFLK
jgi:serine/threonine-protein kinase